MPSTLKTLLLDGDAVARKLTRIALQIREDNFDETRILLAGVKNRGLELAQRLQAELAVIAPELEVVVDYIRMNKDNPVHDAITTGMDPMLWKDEVVVVVDDVAHSGKTLLWALKPFMQTVPRKLQCAVLVDRSHKHYPVHADFVGLSLATMIQEQVQVVIAPNGGPITVYLR
ncbi:MAG: phosphoribosyltransferase [Sphingobacteriia bacterium]|jgi:pyrimidine operon attenuation protein/uracil phosphoribosyltransferase|nr:phosphoribosyltransferase [Sphingobacteriia bacterium]